MLCPLSRWPIFYMADSTTCLFTCLMAFFSTGNTCICVVPIIKNIGLGLGQGLGLCILGMASLLRG